MKENVLTFSDFLYKKSENLYKNRITSALPSYYLAVYSDRILLKNSSFYH